MPSSDLRVRMRVWLPLVAFLLLVPAAGAVHFYRSGGGGCREATGELGTAPGGNNAGATVLLLHNTYHDLATGAPVTVIEAGESVTWRWASLHCHSVTTSRGGGLGTTDPTFDSGFRYPTQAGEVRVLPNFFDYPVPALEQDLTYTKTFATPGIYPYLCVHHAAIGMQGVVVVTEAA
jgi:plastocyanin